MKIDSIDIGFGGDEPSVDVLVEPPDGLARSFEIRLPCPDGSDLALAVAQLAALVERDTRQRIQGWVS